jgi:hypothetical protein
MSSSAYQPFFAVSGDIIDQYSRGEFYALPTINALM